MIRFFIKIFISWIALRSIIYLIPGDASDFLSSQSLVPISSETVRNATASNSLIQHWFRLDQQISLFNQEPALSLFWSSFQKTLILGIYALVFMIAITFSLTYISFIYPKARNTINNAIGFVATIPLIWLAPLSVFIFSFRMHLLPPAGHPLLPAMLLGLSLSTFWTRISIQQMNSPESQAKMIAAHARGFGNLQVFIRDFWIPQLSQYAGFIGTQLGHLFNGSIVLEIIFDWPGVGHLLQDSMLRRDFPVLETTASLILFMVLFTQSLGRSIQSNLRHAE